jgi:hypothetical protein
VAATLDRLKILINSSTPMVVMETVEEPRAISLVRNACSELQLAMFEWSIADGLTRSGSGGGPLTSPSSIQARVEQMGNWGSHSSISPPADTSAAGAKTAVYNSREPVQALANMESMTLEAVFVLKDFHRHMSDPVVIRRLRDVGQKFSAKPPNADPDCAVDRNAARAGQPGGISRAAITRSPALAPNYRGNLQALV